MAGDRRAGPALRLSKGDIALRQAQRTEPLNPAERREVVRRALLWYRDNARDLPWRSPQATPWQVMISEFMLQQTPVERVRQPWQDWVERWPTPAALAASTAGDAVRAWGRLGYPRRALRLHAAARMITEEYGGRVPDTMEGLLRLPGVGSYTAAAIMAFAYRRAELVLDTNVRRLLARVATAEASPAPTPTRAEKAQAAEFLPPEGLEAARWAVAAMELGALVCAARTPRCQSCPISDLCRWRRAGLPVRTDPRRRQAYQGTDRQCRGVLLAAFRKADGPLNVNEIAAHWPDATQRHRALDSLAADGLLLALDDNRYCLPD